MKLKAIVAIDKNYGIGFENKLLVKIPDDLKNFKKITSNNVIIMGRKTYESIGVLPNRINIVLSSKTIHNKKVITAHNIQELEFLVDSIQNHFKLEKEFFVIGGGIIYELLSPYYDEIYITKIDKEYKKVDTYFPQILEDKKWKLVEKSDNLKYNSLNYSYEIYRKE